MRYAEFRQQGWAGRPPFLLLAGEGYLTGEAAALARRGVEAKFPGFANDKLTAPEATFAAALDLFRLLGLWGGIRLVEWSGESLRAEDFRLLKEEAARPATGNLLLLRLATFSEKWAEGLPDSALVVSCDPVSKKTGGRRAQLQWLEDEAQHHGLVLASDGARELLERTGGAPGMVENAFAVMAAAGGHWNAARVREHVADASIASAFDFVEALAERNLERLQQELPKLAASQEPAQIMGVLRHHFRRLLLWKRHQGLNRQEIIKLMKLAKNQEFLLDKLRRQAESLGETRLKRLYGELYNFDRESKMTQDRGTLGFETFAMRLFLQLA